MRLSREIALTSRNILIWGISCLQADLSFSKQIQCRLFVLRDRKPKTSSLLILRFQAKLLRHFRKSNTFLKRNVRFCFKPTPTTLPLISKLSLTRAGQGYNIGNWGGGPSVRSSDKTNHTWKEKACFWAVCFVPDCSYVNICRVYLLRLLCEEDKTKDI